MNKELIIEELILFILLIYKNIPKITKKRAQHYDYALFLRQKSKKILISLLTFQFRQQKELHFVCYF
jgi:hypothetical protein